MPAGKKISNKELAVAGANIWFIVRFDQLLSSNPLRINTLDSKKRDLPNHDLEGHEIDSPGPIGA